MNNKTDNEKEVYHNIPPVFDERSVILVLGSFPSVKSRETEFFYGHKQNRFWKVLAYVFDSPVPQTVDEKKALLLDNRIAVWDVIASCRISGSADSSIKDAVPNDISRIFQKAEIKAVLLNGRTANGLYNKYFGGRYDLPSYCMSSTSPANASCTFEMLCAGWKEIIKLYV